MRHTTPTRRGFTLVELLVAAALTMLIMTILAMSFQTAMDSLSHLRAAGDLQDRLRTAGEKLRQDLVAPHFEDEAISHGMVSNVKNSTPSAGFFRINQFMPSKIEQYTTVQSPRDYSSFSTDHALQMTIRLHGSSRQSIFSAPRPNGIIGFQELDNTHDNLIRDSSTYGTRWAIVSWFLSASQEKTKGPNASLNKQLFILHRKVQLLAERPNCFIAVGVPNPKAVYFAHNTTTGKVFTARDIASGIPVDYTPYLDGSDIVMSNVLSFEIKADYSQVVSGNPPTPAIAATATTPFIPENPQHPNSTTSPYFGYPTIYPRPANALPLPSPPSASGFFNPFPNPDYPFDDLPGPFLSVAPRSFETSFGSPYRVKSLQIKLRVYDPKTMTTRQVTLVQDL